jgi:hypothetical protein
MNVYLAVKNFFPESTHHADAAADRRDAARERASQSLLLVKFLSIRGFFEVKTDFFELDNPIGDFRNHCSNDFLMGNVVAANDRVAEVRTLLSFGSAWPKAACGTPPDVGLEPLLPSLPLSTRITSAPRFDASMAAMQAAKPPPMINTSQSNTWPPSVMERKSYRLVLLS